MEAAKNVVKKFTSKDGQHDTSVHETVNPAVTNETVTQQQEHRVHRAVDKEVHQDHYHTSVQPVHDKEVLPEQHHHRAGEVEHRNFEHGDHQASKDLHASEAAKFQDQTRTVKGETTQTAMPVVGAERTHHHVHEQIQPVVHKQTIEPHVVHTTQPIHETHHNEALHHQTSTLPAVGMGEFKSGGGVLTGRGEKSDAFEGCPKGAHAGTSGVTGNNTTSSTGVAGTGHSHHNHSATSGVTGSSATGTTGVTGSTTGHSHTSDRDGLTGSHSGTGVGHDSSRSNAAGVGAVGGAGATGAAVAGAQSAAAKPSLMDKINPMKDSNGDGQKGFMK